MTTRFIVLAQPRTGSGLLNAALQKHPQVVKHSEIMNHWQEYQLPQDARQRVLAALTPTRPCRAVGCTLHAFQPDRGWHGWERWEPGWDVVAEDPSIRIIRLHRLNALAQLASWRIAELLEMWDDQSQVTERPRIRIAPYELYWFRCWNDMAYDRRMGMLRQHEILEATYESLCDDWGPALERVQKFIGVDTIPIDQPIAKQESRPLIEVIENYDELQAGLKETGRWRKSDV